MIARFRVYIKTRSRRRRFLVFGDVPRNKAFAPARYVHGAANGEWAGRRASDEFGAQAEESIGENRASDGLRHLFAMHMPGRQSAFARRGKEPFGRKVLAPRAAGEFCFDLRRRRRRLKEHFS